MNREVIGVTRLPVGSEGQHVVGLNLGHDRRHLRRALGIVDRRARPVDVVEPVVLGHPEHGEACLHLLGAQFAHARRGPS